MPGKIKNIVKWFQRREVWGAALTLLSFSPEIINSFSSVGILPEYTLLAKLATPIGVLLTVFGLRKGYKLDNLPSGITKALDVIPNEYTGVKGSEK